MAAIRGSVGLSAPAVSKESVQAVRDRWAGEIGPAEPDLERGGGTWPPAFVSPRGQMSAPNGLEMQNHVPDEVITSPTTMSEAYVGSLKAMLARNTGNYIVATFLIGTQGTVSWEGILFDVGNDYVTIYQEPRDRYIVCDIYSLKYMEFYDTRRRELCNELLRREGQNHW